MNVTRHKTSEYEFITLYQGGPGAAEIRIERRFPHWVAHINIGGHWCWLSEWMPRKPSIEQLEKAVNRLNGCY